MIIYWLLVFVTNLISNFIKPISLLPDAVLPAQFTTWLALVGGYIAIAVEVAPYTIAALFVAIGFVVIVENADGLFKVVKFIYKKIPGIS